MEFIKKNIGGLIFAIVSVVFLFIFLFPQIDSGKGSFILIGLITIPIVFIVWVIADFIRKAIHPDMVMTSGFFGLLKEKIFWRIGPQVISSIIVLMIMMNCAESKVKLKQTEYDSYTVTEYNTTNEYKKTTDEIKSSESLSTKNEYIEKAFVIPYRTREDFIKKYASDNQFIETNADRLVTYSKRGENYLKVTGDFNNKNFEDLQEADPFEVLDLSDAKINGGIRFSRKHWISYILLPEGITSLKYSDFGEEILRNTHIKGIFLPSTLTSIEENAFVGMPLEEIVIPPSVTLIENRAFRACKYLQSVFFNDSKIEVIQNETFAGCSSLEYINLPVSIKRIENEAFSGCTSASIKIPDSVINIGVSSFIYVNHVIISDNSKLEIINNRAFYGTGIKIIFLPKTIKKIGEEAFSSINDYSINDYDTNLVNITIHSIVPPEISKNTFAKNIQNIFVPAESLKIYEDAWFDYEFTFNNQLKPIKID